MLSIIIPTIRPPGRDRCIESIHKYIGIEKDKYEIVTEEDINRIGSNLMIKNLVNKTQYDLVLYLGDDTEITEGCIPEALRIMNTFEDGWGMVGLNDQFHNLDDLATHWLAHKKLLPYLDGEFLNTQYRHSFSDAEFILRCKEINRYKPSYNSIIIHHHPIVSSNINWDKDYDRIYSPPYWLHDRQLYLKRLKKGFK